MATSEKDRRAGLERLVIKIAVSLFLGVVLLPVEFLGPRNLLRQPPSRVPNLGVRHPDGTLWGTSQSKKYFTAQLWRIITVFLVVAVWISAVGVMISLLPVPIGEICSILSSWRMLSKAKDWQNKL